MTAKPPAKPPANPFAQLASLREQLPSAPAAAPPPTAAPPPPKGPARAVVRFEKKGRSGKMMTAVEKLALAPAELERWCSELKKELGCGGLVEGDVILLQGDLRARLGPALTRRGVRSVVGAEVHK